MFRQKIVAVSGYFDPLTPGHIEYFYKAKKLGDRLVVILNRDDQLLMKRRGTNLEGKIRYPLEDRKSIISVLKPVDEVSVIDSDTSVAETTSCFICLFSEVFRNTSGRITALSSHRKMYAIG